MRVNVVAPNPTKDILWLLLEAAEHAGSGVLSMVDYIRRLRTRGGVIPNGGTCDPPATKPLEWPTPVYKLFSDRQ